MNINDLYDNIPAEQHGRIIVSSGAVSITQEGKNPPVVLLKSADQPNAELTDGAGKAVDRAHLEKNITTLKPVAPVEATKEFL